MFIRRAKEIHGDKYDYSSVEYIGMHKKVKIICPIDDHGKFYQMLASHLNSKCGCPKCANCIKMTLETFIKKANLVHNNKSIYIYNKIKVEIICPKDDHGSFFARPDQHLNQKHGCAKCSQKIKLTNETFEIKARLIHGNKYNYTKVNYKNNQTKVEIICENNDHGSWFQKPGSHLNQKSGCPKCVAAGFSKKAINWLDSIFYSTCGEYRGIYYSNNKIKS